MPDINDKRNKGYFAELEIARKIISEHETSAKLNEEAKQKLAESVSLLSSFFNSPGAMRGVVEIEGNDIRHITDNSIAAEFFGRTQESMRNMLASQMGIDQSFIDIWIRHYEESKHKKQQVNFEYEHATGSQTYFFSVTVNYLGESFSGFSRYTYVLFDISKHKEVLGALQEAHDSLDRRVEQRTAELAQLNEQLKEEIKERKEVEKALRLERDRAQGYLDTVEAIIVGLDIEGRITLINHKGCRLLGYNEGDLIGRNWFSKCLPQPNGVESVYPLFLKLCSGETEAMKYLENSVLTRDGELRQIAWHNSLIQDEQGKIIGTLSAGEDITERKKLEFQLSQAHKMEAIGTLAGGIAHDFNNMLGIILGNTELAMDDVPEWNPARQNLEEIKIASLRAKDVVRQLLSFARKTDQEQKPLKINPIVTGSLKLLRSSIPASIEIRNNIPKDSAIILSDPTKINQVLINLCTNAAQAMEKDGGVLEVSLNRMNLDQPAAKSYELPPGEYVNLTVSDTGPGISKEVINRIFDPYFTTKEIGKGTGMGLAVVHGVVNEHNGKIFVESKIGEGTRFTIVFPVAEEEAVLEVENVNKIPVGNERILFVDDEDAIVDMTRQMLERLGYRVEARMSPIEALELFQSKPDHFDLVITDMSMPHMNGLKLSQEIKSVRSDIPIIISTGYSSLIDEETSEKFGIDAYVMKPIVMRKIAKTIREVLVQKQNLS